MESQANPVIQECLIALASINRDLNLGTEHWKDRKIGMEDFLRLSETLRSRQVEILRILAENASDPVDRWQKIAGR